MAPEPVEVTSSSRPPLDERTRTLLDELVAPIPLGRVFPEVEFATVEPGPTVLVRLPDTGSIPPAVADALNALAAACLEEYGYGVEVIPDDRDDVYAALDLIRRHVDR
jgi:hypothetical protein